MDLFWASSLLIFDSTKSKVDSGGGSSAKINFYLYLKLAAIMGLGWSLGLAAGFASQVAALWYAFIVCNALQGLLIFVSFTCTRKVWKGLRHRWKAVTSAGSSASSWSTPDAWSKRKKTSVAPVTPLTHQTTTTTKR